jgi:hypothetical protein
MGSHRSSSFGYLVVTSVLGAVLLMLAACRAPEAPAPGPSGQAESAKTPVTKPPGSKPPCGPGHNRHKIVWVSLAYPDGSNNPNGAIPKIFVVCSGDDVTWKLHDPGKKVEDFDAQFESGANPFDDSGSHSKGKPTSGPATGQPYVYYGYTLTVTMKEGTKHSFPPDPGGMIIQ